MLENSLELKKSLEKDDLTKTLISELKKSTDSVFFSGQMSMKEEGVTIYSRGPFSFGQTSLVAISAVGAGAALVMPALGTARSKAQAKRVTNGLKQCGLGMMMYFADGSQFKVPENYHEAYEWDLQFFEQPNLNFTPLSWDEVFDQASPWKFFIKPGQLLSDIENSEVPLIAVPAMKNGGKLLVLHGDGHVESVIVPGVERNEFK